MEEKKSYDSGLELPMSATDIQVLHKEIIMEVFRTFLAICQKYDLKYYCAGGTTIGVVRHQAMIPWDDDIDIVMPRPDYDRFLALFSSLELTDYEMVSMETCDTYYLPYAKLCRKNTTLLEFADIPCVFGVFIDIFPLDGAAATEEERMKEYVQIKRVLNKLMVAPKRTGDNLRSGVRRLFKMQLRTAINEFYYAFNKAKKRKALVQDINRVMTARAYEDSSYVCNYGGMWGVKEFCPKDWLGEGTGGVFGGLQVVIPREYDRYLTQLYGNYMVPPPVEKQVSHHYVAYMNLTKRESLEEVHEYLRNKIS